MTYTLVAKYKLVTCTLVIEIKVKVGGKEMTCTGGMKSRLANCTLATGSKLTIYILEIESKQATYIQVTESRLKMVNKQMTCTPLMESTQVIIHW